MNVNKIKLKKAEDEKVQSEPEVQQEEKELNYQQKYYRDKKAELAVKKKERYENDPEYREKVKKRAIERWFEKYKKDPSKSMKDMDEITFDKRNMRIVMKEGKKIRFFSSKNFAKIVGVTPATLLNWQNDGILPATNYVEGNVRKWFSEVYVENVKKVLLERKFSSTEVLKELLAEQFKEVEDYDFTGKAELSDEMKMKIQELFEGDE